MGVLYEHYGSIRLYDLPMSIEKPEPPTRARYILALWLCGLSSILYLDRICMSQAVKPIREELDLSKTEMSLALMSFTLSYGLFAVPAGRLGDRIGPRFVLSVLVAVWSIFTGFTGLAGGLLTLILVRFLFGAAEAGAFPNAARIMTRWFPLSERGRVQGIMLSFAQVGAVAAPAATAWVIEYAGWRWAFFSYAAIGAAWAIGFWLWFRDDPANHSQVNPSELDEIKLNSPPPPPTPGPIPWHAILTNYGIWILALMMITGSFFTYFFYSWFPTYLTDARGMTNIEAGNLNSLAIGGSAVGMLLGGWIADRITRLSSDPIRHRRYACIAGFLIAAACMSIGTHCEEALTTAIMWSAAMAAMHIQLPNWWSVVIPQAGKHTATIFGLTNGVGVIGALSSQGFVAVFADYQHDVRGLSGREQWDPMFDVYTLVLIGGAVAWWLYRFTPIEEPEENATDVAESPAAG
jgi:ACS family glucarate transporter-like MFS transporter